MKTCPTCGRDFKSQKGMRRHHTMAHGESLRPDLQEPEDGIECPTCEKVCVDEHGLKSHHVQVHGESLVEYVEVKCHTCGQEDRIRDWQAEEREKSFCSDQCWSEWKSKATSEQMIGREITWRDKISDSLKETFKEPENHPCYGREWSEEERQNHSEIFSGREIEWADKIAKTFEEEVVGGWKQIEVEETGHVVRSSWEVEIDLMLYEEGIDYEYEPRSFDVGRTYWPDFVSGDIIVEVKGYASDDCIEKASAFMQEYSDFTYVVVGDEMPADVHIEWDDRRELLSLW